ncbi:MAG: OmpA family protein [Deltaproteobacteria bacterium]|nr:OmpA family protein [Deltaproteobacteria bacterium]
MSARASLVLASAVVLTAIAPTASAQEGFAMNRFEPSERGSEWFVADTLDLRGKLRPAAGLVMDYGHRPFVSERADGSTRAIVDHQLFAHVGGSVVFLDRFRAGLTLPLALSQGGDSARIAGRVYSGSDKGGVGDLRLGLDARLLGNWGETLTVAAGLRLWLPTGNQDRLLSDGTVRIGPHVSVAGDAVLSYAARVGILYRGQTDGFGGHPTGSELVFSLAAGKRFLDKRLLVGPELVGSTVMKDFFAGDATPLEVLFGGHYTAGDFRFGAGVGPGLTKGGTGSPAFRALLSFEWVPGPAPKVVPKPGDKDGDGAPDGDDACPEEVGVHTGEASTNGCPDRDKDGVIDRNDACPDDAGPHTDEPKTNGCPVPGDKDGDGVTDEKDACPDLAGIKSDDPKLNGCPSDRDKDGILDDKDACPDLAGIKSADPANNGCPGDKDLDSIRDDQDACPDQSGPKNDDPKKNGCPEVRIEAGQVKILEQIKFKTGSAVILKESQHIIDLVAKVLKEHPEIKKLRVEGHTDNKGNAKTNKTLSKQRAAAVVTALGKAGVDKKRLVSEGFGQEKPIDTNDTEPGRANNRRVEFHIVDEGKK